MSFWKNRRGVVGKFFDGLIQDSILNGRLLDLYTYTHIYTHTRTHMHTYTYTHTCMCTHTYTYTCTHNTRTCTHIIDTRISRIHDAGMTCAHQWTPSTP